MSGHTQADSAFPPTRWTAVIQLRDAQETHDADQALASLCEQYWYPLYAFARRAGRSPHDAQDVTQGFFCHVLERNLFAEANPELGRMRSFLLTAFQRFSNGQRIHDEAQKRGGGRQILSLDVTEGEDRYHLEPAHELTPAAIFECAWAHTVIDRAVERLKRKEIAAKREEQFAELSAFLTPDGHDPGASAAAAERLGLSAEAVRQNISRLRKRFREALREEVADTLTDPTPEAVEGELQALKSAISQTPS